MEMYHWIWFQVNCEKFHHYQKSHLLSMCVTRSPAACWDAFRRRPLLPRSNWIFGERKAQLCGWRLRLRPEKGRASIKWRRASVIAERIFSPLMRRPLPWIVCGTNWKLSIAETQENKRIIQPCGDIKCQLWTIDLPKLDIGICTP